MKFEIFAVNKLPISIIYFISFLLFQNTYSQNTLQIIKFEEAQEMFNSNKFKEAVTILTDLENKGLKNPKVLHLKILAKSNYNNQDITEEVLGSLKSDVNKYLKDYDIQGLEDKYKEVYIVSKKMETFESILMKRQADSFFASGDFDKALPIYLKCIGLVNNDIDLIVAISNTYNELSKSDNNLRIESVKWKEKAAEMGHIQSFVDVAIIYKEGLTVPRDVLKAAKYFKKAASENHPDGQFGMGWIYEFGVEGKFDLNEAYKWYNLAADNPIYHAEAVYNNKNNWFNKNNFPKIIEKSNSSNHSDYYIRERAMLYYLTLNKSNFNNIDLAKEVFDSFKTGADEKNSPMAQLFLYYIYNGMIRLKSYSDSNNTIEKNQEIAEKYLSEAKKNIEKNKLFYLYFLIANDLGYMSKASVSATVNEIYSLYDLAVGGGNFEAKQFLIYRKNGNNEKRIKNILNKYGINY